MFSLPTSLVTEIDTRYGTYNSHAFSNGNTLPLTGHPFGMNYFAPQTTDQNGSWWFNPYEPVYQGIRLTHQASPWVGDFSHLLLTPISGKLQRDTVFHRQSSYDISSAIFRPDLLQLHSNRYNLTSRLAPSLYGASLEMASDFSQSLGLVLYAPDRAIYQQISDYEIGATLYNATETQSEKFAIYIRIRFDQAITGFSQLKEDQVVSIEQKVDGNDLHIRVDFDAPSLSCQLATSFISLEQATMNLELQEDFPTTQKKTQETWDHLLGRVAIFDRKHDKQKDLFYHCLYRCLLFPQTFYEKDENGNPIHFDTTSATTKPGIFFTNNGYWDTFRSSYPLLSILYPDYLEQFLEGILQHYKDTGFLPKWLAPDERGIMPGTLVDGVIADCCQKGIGRHLMPQLLEAMVKTSQAYDPSGRYGRHGNLDYQVWGYLPAHHRESVSHSLDYAYSDWAISQVADQLGQKEIAERYAKASQGYQSLFDTETSYMRAKDKNGLFTEPFDPYAWGRDYAECSAIQATLSVFHDIDGLIELMGGKSIFTDYLIKLVNQPAIFQPHNYGYEIHEMSEMAQTTFGQLAISNQPSFHIPYLFQYSNKPEYTSLLVKKLRNQAFDTGFQAFPGDEDNGSMAAWYILSCLGFYPLCPGNGRYELGIPQFDKVQLQLADGHKLTITTKNNHDHYDFARSAILDGNPIQQLSHDQLIKADTLDFNLSLLS